MQRVIDISEEMLEWVNDVNKFYIEYGIGDFIDVIKNGTPIPDNATNGDVIKAMFPYYSYERNDYVQSTEDYIVDSMECMEHDLYFGFDWWNTPYQKGGRE